MEATVEPSVPQKRRRPGGGWRTAAVISATLLVLGVAWFVFLLVTNAPDTMSSRVYVVGAGTLLTTSLSGELLRRRGWRPARQVVALAVTFAVTLFALWLLTDAIVGR